MKVIMKSTFLLILTLWAGNSFAENLDYIIAQSQHNLLKAENRLSDTIANANTTAYKQETDIFSEDVVHTMIKERISFQKISDTKRDFSQGNLVPTERPLDVAIIGEGFFKVETPNGNRFTRAGNLAISNDGTLITNEGYPLIGPGGGHVEFDPADINVKIANDGIVSSNGEERGNIGVFIFDNILSLTREGANMYKSSELEKIAEDFQIAQGMLESSNVNTTEQMIKLSMLSEDIQTTKRIETSHHNLMRDMIGKLSPR